MVEGGGPSGTAEGPPPSACPDELIQKLIDALQAAGDQLAERERAWREGFELGWRSAYEVGYGAALWEAFQGGAAWRAGEPVGLGPSRAELAERRRLTHGRCDRDCGRCSRCIRADAYARQGGDFIGLPAAMDQWRRRFGVTSETGE